MEETPSSSPVQSTPLPVSFQNQQPSAPEIEVKPAGAWSRYWATFIDSFILGIPVILVVFLLNALLKSPISFRGDVTQNLENNAFYIAFLLLFYFLYYTYLTGKYGTTLGKDAYGLKVVGYPTQESISYKRAFLREILKIGILIIPLVGILIYIINGLVIAFSPQKRGIHDLIAKTQVLRVKKAWGMPKQLGCAVIVILATTLVFGLGWTLFKTVGPTKPPFKTSVAPPTSELATFENPDLGYSIQYDKNKFTRLFDRPSDKALFWKSYGVSDFCINMFAIDVEENPQKLTLEQYIAESVNSQGDKYYGQQQEPITINNIQGLKITRPFSYRETTPKEDLIREAKTVSFLLPKSDKIFVLWYSTSGWWNYPADECQENETAIQKTFLTFKFL